MAAILCDYSDSGSDLVSDEVERIEVFDQQPSDDSPTIDYAVIPLSPASRFQHRQKRQRVAPMFSTSGSISMSSAPSPAASRTSDPAASRTSDEHELLRDHPALASHERIRKMKQKPTPPTGARGPQLGATRKTEPPKGVTPYQRCNVDFPKQGLKPHGKDQVWCQPCGAPFSTDWSALNAHCCKTAKHKAKLEKWETQKGDDTELCSSLVDYYKGHPQETGASVDPAVMVYRYRAVEAFMFAGCDLAKVKYLRKFMHRSEHSLTDDSHLRPFIPKVEAKELQTIKSEMGAVFYSVVFDGTTRRGEAIAMTGRWCNADFTALSKRLIMFKTTEKHVRGKQLATVIATGIMTTLSLDPNCCVSVT